MRMIVYFEEEIVVMISQWILRTRTKWKSARSQPNHLTQEYLLTWTICFIGLVVAFKVFVSLDYFFFSNNSLYFDYL